MNGIKICREKAGFTQVQLAQKLKTNQSTVAMWETGNSIPRSERLPKLAKALSCSIDDLYNSEIA